MSVIHGRQQKIVSSIPEYAIRDMASWFTAMLRMQPSFFVGRQVSFSGAAQYAQCAVCFLVLHNMHSVHSVQSVITDAGTCAVCYNLSMCFEPDNLSL